MKHPHRLLVASTLLGMPFITCLLSACMSGAHASKSNDPASPHTVTVQCTVTTTSTDTPCMQEARQTCDSENIRLQHVASKNVIPATQGLDQTPMPITQYVATFECND